jgi:ABC-2 type transport system ATP-binding protein
LNQAIRTFNLTKCYPKSQGWGQILSWGELDTPAVDGVSLDVYQGELFGLLGPNGAGKTTLIKMLATLIQPNGGTAWVNGFPLHNEAAIKASIGLVTSDERSFYWRLTGFQNLSFFASLHGLSPTLVNERARDMLERVGLTKVADKRFQTYSTGMRQRLSIARSLLNKPRILFLDEPTRGLDPTATKAIHELILDELIDQQGLTVFLTTHYLGEAESLCNRIAIMDHGRIQACGTVNELRGTLALNHHYQIQVAGTRPDIQKALTNSAKDSGFNFRYDRNIAGGDTVSDINYKEHVPGETTRITFTTLGGDKALNRVIDSLRQNRVDILDITNQAPSLICSDCE